jgi:hypothetical protein
MLSAFASVTIGPAMPTVTPLKSGAVCGRTGATLVGEPRGVPWQAAEAGGENANVHDANGSDSSSFPCIAAGERTDPPVSPARLLSDKSKRALCEMSRNGGPNNKLG